MTRQLPLIVSVIVLLTLSVVASFWYVPLDHKRLQVHVAPNFQRDFGREDYLLIPHPIPEADCALMARVLKEEAGMKDSSEIYMNADGKVNCEFARYGIQNMKWVEYKDEKCTSGCYTVEPAASNQAVISGNFETQFRKRYVTEPFYSLLRTRLKIEFGRNGEGGSGYICTYNRFSGKWVKEGECNMTWVS